MDANKILKIKVDKKNYILFINNKEYVIDGFYYESILPYENKVLEVKQMLELISFSKANALLNKTYKKIFNHSISYYDFKTKLRKNELSEDDINRIVSFFLENGYLKDQDFADHFKEIYEKSKGINKYKLFLEKNHIPRKMIEKSLLDYKENKQLALNYSNKYLNSKVGSNALIKQKIYVNLLNKGFSHNLAKEVVSELLSIDETNNLLKDIEKYQRKYNNDYYKIYQKLLSLGYNSNMIKEMLKHEN